MFEKSPSVAHSFRALFRSCEYTLNIYQTIEFHLSNDLLKNFINFDRNIFFFEDSCLPFKLNCYQHFIIFFGQKKIKVRNNNDSDLLDQTWFSKVFFVVGISRKRIFLIIWNSSREIINIRYIDLSGVGNSWEIVRQIESHVHYLMILLWALAMENGQFNLSIGSHSREVTIWSTFVTEQ